MKITAEQIRKKGKKMSAEELQQHLKNIKAGVGVRPSKKKYTRKEKHKGQIQKSVLFFILCVTSWF